MPDSIEKKVLIDVQVATDDARAAMHALANEISQLNQATVNMGSVAEQSKSAVDDLAQQMAQSKLTTQQYREELARLSLERRKEIDTTKKAKESVVAAKGSYNEAAQALSKLGKEIKSVENGFKSTDPAIQKQIKEYNKLNTQLKEFDAQMGNHQRKVGEYERAMTGMSDLLNRLVPGFGQFQSALRSASQVIGFMPMKTKQAEGGITSMANATGNAVQQAQQASIGFKNFQTGATASGEAAEGAEAGIGSLSAGMIGMIAAAAGVVAIIGVVISWFAKLTPNSEMLKRQVSGVGAAFTAFMSDLGKGVGFSELFKDMSKAHNLAVTMTGDMQDLARQTQIVAVANSKADEKIADLQLKMRNRRVTPEQEQSYFNQIQEISNNSYKQRKDIADKEYDIAIRAATIGRKFTDDELLQLKQKGVAYAAYLDKIKGLANKEGAGTDVAAIAKAQEDQEAAERFNKTTLDRAQNRLDARQMKADEAAQKEADELAKIKQQTEEANSERIASITRMLGFQREAFAKELDDADEHYRQLIFKQRKFIEDQEKIANSKASTGREKSAARGAIAAAQSDIDQLYKEHYADREEMLRKHGIAVLAETLKSANELKQAQIQSVSDTNTREQQSNALEYNERIEALNAQANAIVENEKRLIAEMKTAKGEQLQVLKDELAHEKQMYSDNRDEATEAQESYNQKETDRVKKHAQNISELNDQLAIIKAKRKKGFGGGDDNPFNTDLENAQIQQSRDNTQGQLESAGLDGDKNKDGSAFSDEQLKQKVLITQQGEDAVTAIKKAELKKRTDMEVDAAKQVADETFQILQQSAQRNEQNAITSIEKQKNYDLQNQALTATQKYAIDERARVQEGQAKVKAFHQEQEIALAKGAIDTAAAIIKAAPNPVLIALAAATGALELGVIASEKAPAYASGGIHYESDGRGGVLPGYSRTDNMNARLRSGEGIVVSEAMRDPWAKSVVSAINQSYGGRSFDGSAPVNWSVPHFASGGIYQSYVPTTDNGLRPGMAGVGGSGMRMHPDDIAGIANAVSNINFPPIDIKDVNRQQQLLAQPYDRTNY